MTKLNHGFTNSTMLSNCDYDTETHELIVTFNGGRSYTYIDVDRRLYDELIDAKSAGKYFNLAKTNLKVKPAS